MMIDIETTLTVLRVLAVNEGNGPITEENVALGYEARVHKPAYTGRIRASLEECRRQRWAEETQDEWGRPCWSITRGGKERDAQ